jgi:hypothetical protein
MFIEVTPFARVRILEKQNRLQMSQVFSRLSINHQMALLFKDSIERDQKSKGTGFPGQLYMQHESKNQTQYVANANLPGPLTLTNSVPQKRGRFTQATLLQTRP